MPKRFTATEKWSDPWFCNLSQVNRIFWIYLLDSCNHAGIWQLNKMLIEVYFGKGFSIPWEELEGRVVQLKGEKYFIPKFIEFQYGTLNSDNRLHQSVISILQKEGAYKDLTRTLLGPKDKEQDKDKVKVQEQAKNKESYGLGIIQNDPGFEAFWEAFPKGNKLYKGSCAAAWASLGPDIGLQEKIMTALEFQKSAKWSQTESKFIPSPVKWLEGRGWEADIAEENVRRSNDAYSRPRKSS